MRARSSTPLDEIVDGVHTSVKTVRLPERGNPDAVSTVSEFLSKHDVETVRDPSVSGQVRIENDGEVLASDPLVEVARFVESSPSANPLDQNVPSVVERLDDNRFQSYDKRRMILASRIVEFRAWNEGSGVLHAGFQRLSKVDFQRKAYRNLGRVDLDVHVYGIDDWDRPDDVSVTVHASRDPEVTDNWWVAYDGDGDDRNKIALLAHELGPQDWYGFWTYDPDTVDEILARMDALA